MNDEQSTTRPKRPFFGAKSATVKAQKAQSKEARRAELVTKYGRDPDALDLIERVLQIDAELIGLLRGSAETRLDRKRERRLWNEKRDKLIRKLERLRVTRLDSRLSEGDVDAAKAHLIHLEGLTDYAAVERYESRLDRECGGDYLASFRALLEARDPSWLTRFDQQCRDRRDAEIAAAIDAELAAMGVEAFINKYSGESC
jgi:hypothetical protein